MNVDINKIVKELVESNKIREFLTALTKFDKENGDSVSPDADSQYAADDSITDDQHDTHDNNLIRSENPYGTNSKRGTKTDSTKEDQHETTVLPDNNLFRSGNPYRTNFKGGTKTVGEFYGAETEVSIRKFDNTRYIMASSEENESSTICSKSIKYPKNQQRTPENKAGVFTGENVMKTHTMTRNNRKHFICQICNQSFSSESHLKVHNLVHNKGNRPFPRDSSLKIPIRVCSEKNCYPCSTCGRLYNSKDSLWKINIMVHDDEKPFLCLTCGRSFARKSDLKRHTMIHNNEKPFSCATCGRSFTQKGSLKIHIMRHNDEKPVFCSICSRSFFGKSELNRHSLVHNDEKSFSCATCGRSFTQERYLKAHTMRHNNKKPFLCSICGRLFSLKHHLQGHIMTHENKKPL